MPAKGCKLSEEAKDKIGMANLGRTRQFSDEHKAKISISLKGTKRSYETRKKVSIAALQRAPVSMETRKIMSMSRQGEKNPNYGKQLSEETRAKMRKAWGTRTPASLETRARISESQRGQKKSEETKTKMCLAQQRLWQEIEAGERKPRRNGMLGKKHTEETKTKIRAKRNEWNRERGHAVEPGHKRKSGGGYVELYCPTHPKTTKDGFVPEHRLIMESILGRYLQFPEVVHHKNGIRTDNRPDNLELATRGSHTKDHNKGYTDGYEKGYKDGVNAQIEELRKEIRLLMWKLKEGVK